jgi:hypothetical protein
VHRHSLINLVTWPVTGLMPPQLTEFTPRRTLRGPTPVSPVLHLDERHRFFDHMQAIAEAGSHTRATLMRRQAIYLLGFDQRPAAITWLGDEWHRVTRRRHNSDLAAQLEMRTASVTLASAGDPELMHDFVARLDSDRRDIVNLNYWAHWIGEIQEEHQNDEFMLAADPRRWSGFRLLEHLIPRLRPDSPHLPLNLHTLHSLVASRPALLTEARHTHTLVAGALDLIGSQDGLVPTVREQLAGLAFAVRIANR